MSDVCEIYALAEILKGVICELVQSENKELQVPDNKRIKV